MLYHIAYTSYNFTNMKSIFLTHPVAEDLIAAKRLNKVNYVIRVILL